MREIKFRTWDSEKKRMLYPRTPLNDSELVICFNGEVREHWFIDAGYGDSADAGLYDVSQRFKLMQWTGLQDSKGKDIYEGDIVRFEVENKDMWSGDNKGCVIYEDHRPCFSIKTSRSGIITIGMGYDAYPGTLEVVSNKYENPELLKKRG